MKLIYTLALLGVLAASIETKEVVCYIPTWAPDITSKVDTSLCTMFMIAFGTVDSAGNVGLPTNFANFKKLRTSSSKLLLAIGGANDNAKAAFSTISSTDAGRTRFAQNCLNIVKNNGLDGIDIDWEFPINREQSNFVALHQKLKSTLGSSYLVTSAVSVGNYNLNILNIYDMKGLAAVVDFLNLMAYDLHGSWESVVNFNAPVKASNGDDSVEQGVKYWLKSAPASKLNLGVPFYANVYQLADPRRTAPGSATGKQVAQPAYNTYCPKLVDSSWTKQRDPLALAPYMYSGNSWISYEDQQSIKDKANIANQYNLGGVMLWSLDQDDYNGVCSSCKWPLLKALNAAIGQAASCTGGSITTTTQKTTTTTKRSGGATTIKTCTATGLFSYPRDCSKYYNCPWVGYAPYIMSCPTGLKFNSKISNCDYTCA